MAEKNRYATKKKGNTEVDPFWYTKDIKGVMDYFKNNGMWDDYLIFMFGLLLGRRIGDIVSMKWSDLYFQNGRMRMEIRTIEEQKTGKTEALFVTPFLREEVNFYLEETGKKPMYEYEGFIFNIEFKDLWIKRKNDSIYRLNKPESELLEEWCIYLKKNFSEKRKSSILKDYEKVKDNYSNFGEYLYEEVEYKDIVKWQSDNHRKIFKKAAAYVGIEYPVSCHSSRKTFGYWSEKIHPDDPQSLYILQNILAHDDIRTTMKYIGLTTERKRQYFVDISEFIRGVSEGKEQAIDNTPVVSLKTDMLRNILMFVIRNKDKDELELLNESMKMVEKSRIGA